MSKAFSLGQVVGTPQALDVIIQANQKPSEFLDRHARCDWGMVSEESWKANDDALKDGDRLLSVYNTKTGAKIWIITESDRSVTTILLPEDY